VAIYYYGTMEICFPYYITVGFVNVLLLYFGIVALSFYSTVVIL